MTWTEAVVQLFTAFLGSLAFSILFHVETKHVLWAALGGFIGWGALLLTQEFFTPDPFMINFVSAASAVLYAEIMARICRAPTTVFIVISIIPMVPGGGLFYTMSAFVEKNAVEFSQRGMSTLMTALGLAAGIVFTTVVVAAIPEHIRAKLYFVRPGNKEEKPNGRIKR